MVVRTAATQTPIFVPATPHGGRSHGGGGGGGGGRFLRSELINEIFRISLSCTESLPRHRIRCGSHAPFGTQWSRFARTITRGMSCLSILLHGKNVYGSIMTSCSLHSRLELFWGKTSSSPSFMAHWLSSSLAQIRCWRLATLLISMDEQHGPQL